MSRISSVDFSISAETSSVDFSISAETSSVDFSISAEGGNFVFRAIPAGTTAFLCATHFTPPWSKICDWVTQIYNKKTCFPVVSKVWVALKQGLWLHEGPTNKSLSKATSSALHTRQLGRTRAVTGSRNSGEGAFVGIASETKFQILKLKYETLEISEVVINPYFVLSCIILQTYRQSSSLPAAVTQTNFAW